MLELKLTSFTMLDLVESILCSVLFYVEEKEQCMRKEQSSMAVACISAPVCDSESAPLLH